ncbi:MAG: ATP-binding protein [Bacillota bacterium]
MENKLIEQDSTYTLPPMEAKSHILYIFNQVDKYIENAVHFILDGLRKNEVILFVDTMESFEKVMNELREVGYHSSRLSQLIFAESTETYVIGDEFNLDKTGDLIHLLNPFYEKGLRIRTWGQVLIPHHESTLERLSIFEKNSDDFIAKSHLISVCAYNGLAISAFHQNELMRTHTHFMTDSEFIISPLYDRTYLRTPSIREKEQLRLIAKQNQELRDKNISLAYKNKMISLKNKVIAESEKKLQAVIEQLPNPMIIRRASRILFINDTARRQFSINSQNIEKENHLHQFFQKYHENASVRSETNKVQNHHFILKNGDEKYFIVKSIELMFEGEPTILHSFLDISQEKENERLIVRSEKMNIAGELAASIAHEIRNPLTAIKGFFQLINREDEHEMYHNVIEDELSRIEQITSELLTLAKPHSEKRRNLNFVQLVKEVTFLLTSQANSKSIVMLLEVERNEMYISCEETKIKQVFINLLKNAIDAIESGGKIVLKMKEIDNHIEVQVIDEGKGIPKELIKRIGEPFYTTKDKGTGLGLMVCFRIIENHEGTIKVISENGVGTTFTITLPALRELDV